MTTDLMKHNLSRHTWQTRHSEQIGVDRSCGGAAPTVQDSHCKYTPHACVPELQMPEDQHTRVCNVLADLYRQAPLAQLRVH